MAKSNATRRSAKVIGALSVGLAATVTAACINNNETPEEPPETPVTGEAPPSVHLALSGGGYHALSGAASWWMGMMERNGDYDFESAASNVKAISSGSGGTWFLTLTTYSKTFVEQLQSEGEYKNFAAPTKALTKQTGYMTNVWKYIRHPHGGCDAVLPSVRPLCDAFVGLLNVAGQAGFVNFLLSGGGQWQSVIENSVFGKAKSWPYYKEVKDLTISGNRNAWAQDKDLIFNTAILTEEPALTFSFLLDLPIVGNVYEGIQSLQGSQPAFAGDTMIRGAAPLALAVTGDTTVDFLPGGTMNLKYGTWKDGFHDGDAANSLTNDEMNAVVGQFPVINAAAASSAAAGGYIDIPDMTGNIPKTSMLAVALDGAAPGYQFYDATTKQSVVKFHADVNKDFHGTPAVAAFTSKLAANKVTRLTDAGFVDNTAVAPMVRYLQDSSADGQIPDGFNIVSFDDFPLPPPNWDPVKMTGTFPTGADVAGLFGFDNCNKTSCSMQKDGLKHGSMLGLVFVGSSAQVFDCDGYFPPSGQAGKCDGPPLTKNLFWTATGDNRIMCGKDSDVEQPLTYSRIDVTINTDLPGSKLFGLTANNNGVKGTLHVFAILGGTAAVVPGSAIQYACYDTMIQGMVNNIVETKGDACDPSKTSVDSDNDCSLGDYLEYVLSL